MKEQKAHALSVERFIEEERKARVESQLNKAEKREERVERYLKKAEKRKTELERQWQVEENRKARLANIKQGIHKPEFYEAAEAFIRALSWSQVEVLAVDLMECKGWVARQTQPGADLPPSNESS